MEYSAPEKSPCTKKVRFIILLIVGLRNLVKYRAGDANGNPKIPKSPNHKYLKKIVMNTQITNTRIVKEIATVINQTRSTVISAADVWNIQRQKRVRVQRRFAL